MTVSTVGDDEPRVEVKIEFGGVGVDGFEGKVAANDGGEGGCGGGGSFGGEEWCACDVVDDN